MAMPEQQLNPVASPLTIRCACCGADAHFDLLRQRYHCLFCGGNTEIEDARRQLADWHSREQARIRDRLWHSSDAVYSCPGCGSAVLLSEAEDLNCVFCGSAMERSALSRELPVPPLVLPFALSLDEAKQQLKAWAEKNLLQKAILTSWRPGTCRCSSCRAASPSRSPGIIP